MWDLRVPFEIFVTMNFEKYKSNFREKASNQGYSEDEISLCINYAERLVGQGLPIIFNLTHLSRLVGFEKKYLSQAAVVSKHSETYYRYYRVRKKNGGTREIKEPLPNLKKIQHWILENILERIPPSGYAKAYVKGRGLKENLRFHRKQKKVFSIDLKDFFPSINFEQVEQIFLRCGYSTQLSNILAKLCCLKNQLPQGAPTSPYISNLVFKEIDYQISNYCKEKKIRFTRYADDLTFSGEFDEKELFKIVQDIIATSDFVINHEKTALMLSNERQIVTGIVVNDKPQLDNETRRKIRMEHYFIVKYGLKSHMQQSGINNPNYLNALLGTISFGLYLNPKDDRLRRIQADLIDVHKKYL